MAIKVPFYYTSYKDSKLATAFDKACHSSEKVVIGFALSFILGIYAYYCLNSIPMAESVKTVLTVIACAVIGIIFVGSFFMGLICDKFELSRKIAIWDINRKNSGNKFPKKLVLTILAVIAVLAVPGIIAYACSGFSIFN